MILEHAGARPQIANSAYIAPNAVVSGDVTIGEDARVLFGAVLTAEGGPVEVGTSAIVMEHALVRGRADHPTQIGDNVLVGPHTHVNGARIEDNVFLATGVSVFPGAHVGMDCEVRINGVVHANANLWEGTTVPIGWVAAGDPAELFAPAQHEQLWPTQRDADFPRTVFGLAREDATMDRIAGHYAELFGRHKQDRRLDE